MWPILIALTLIFPFLYKYSFVITNQYSQIPIILSFLDRNYLSNDWYVNVSREFGPRTIFAFYMAQTARLFTLPLSFFLHYLLYIFLIAYSTYKLSFILFRNKFIALTTTISILFGTSITLGGNILVTNDFSAPQLPLGLSLLGIVLLLEKKYFFSSLVFAFASYLHPHFGFEGALLFYGINLIILFISKEKEVNFIKKALLPFPFLTLPLFILYLKEAIDSSISSLDKLNILAFMRNLHHYVPSTWPPANFLHFIFFLILFISLLLFFRKKLDKVLFDFFCLSLVFIVTILLLGFLATEIFPFYPIVALQPFRLTLYLYWLGTVIIIGVCLSLALNKKNKYSFLFLIPVFISNTQIFLPTGRTNFIALLLAISLCLFFYKIPKKLFLVLLLVFFSLLRFHQKLNFSSYINYPTEETETALWATENTLSSSLFLVPPEFEKFRLVAERSIVADWKSFPFQGKAMLEWAQRMCEIGHISSCDFRKITLPQVIKGYQTLTTGQILKLQEKYGFQYFISDKFYKEFRYIFKNNYYVYQF